MARRKNGSLLGSLFGLLVTKPRAKAKARTAATRDFNRRTGKLAQRSRGLERAAAEKARIKAERERERARRLAEQAERARLKSVARPARAKAATADKKANHLDDVARRIERGEYQPGEIKELMRSGQLRVRTL